MLLATRCPFCETVFRLLLAQLAARRGLVRCGQCQQVFDATDSLYQLPPDSDFRGATRVPTDTAAALAASVASQPAAADDSAPATEPDPHLSSPREPYTISPRPACVAADVQPHDVAVPWQADERPEPAFAMPSAPGAEPPSAMPVSGTHAARMHPHDPETDAAEPSFFGVPPAGAAGRPGNDADAARPGWQDHPVAPASAAHAQPFNPPLPHDDSEHFAVIREPRAAHGAGRATVIAGMLATVVLLGLLLAQLAWWQRETVMVAWPASQSWYAQACAHLGCTVAPPRDIEGIVVEPSNLREVDNDPHTLELHMPLRNRFGVVLAWPAIELTLLDRQRHVVVRRVLFAQDYVPRGVAVAAGIPPHTLQTMTVRLDPGEAVATSFVAQIFYP